MSKPSCTGPQDLLRKYSAKTNMWTSDPDVPRTEGSRVVWLTPADRDNEMDRTYVQFWSLECEWMWCTPFPCMCSLEGLMLKLKLQYFGHLMQRVDSLEKTDAGKDWRQEEKGATEDEIAGWHHRLHGREFEWTLGDGDGQGGLACCDSWDPKESETTERLNWTEEIISLSH